MVHQTPGVISVTASSQGVILAILSSVLSWIYWIPPGLRSNSTTSTDHIWGLSGNTEVVGNSSARSDTTINACQIGYRGGRGGGRGSSSMHQQHNTSHFECMYSASFLGIGGLGKCRIASLGVMWVGSKGATTNQQRLPPLLLDIYGSFPESSAILLENYWTSVYRKNSKQFEQWELCTFDLPLQWLPKYSHSTISILFTRARRAAQSSREDHGTTN